MNVFKKLKESFDSKTLAITAAAMAGAQNIVSAQNSIPELETQASKVLKLFQGKTIAIIMCIALMIIFAIIAWGNSQGEGGSTIKKMTPWIIGVVGIGSAVSITTYFLGVSPE